MKKWVSICLIALIILGFFAYRHTALRRGEVGIGDTQIQVDIADTAAKREQGLSGRKSLSDSEGMLFVFDTPGKYGFWMKDMNFALDIVWLDSEKHVVGVEKDISPDSYPQVFWPNEAIKYVLELPSGFAQRHSVDTGSQVNFAL